MNKANIIISIIIALFQGTAVSTIIFKELPSSLVKGKLSRYIFHILISIYCVISFFLVPNQYRFILSILVISLLISLAFNYKTIKVIFYSFCTHIIMSFSEILISFLLIIFGINSKEIITIPKYNLIANVLIALVSILIIKISLIQRGLNKTIELFNKNRILQRYFYVFIIILYIIVLRSGFELLFKTNYYINVIFIIGIVIISSTIIRNELKYVQLDEQNKMVLNHIRRYEKIITEQGKKNHEFKNQLMVIRGYAQMNSPKLMDYIDSLASDLNKGSSSFLISQLNKFPDGGIKGLLYYKLSVMEDYKINYEITVEQGVKTSLNNLTTSEYVNITKVLGVLLDNAIDACNQAKDKKIIIDVRKEKSVVSFKLYNTYKGKIDLSKIGTGYTTKGKGRGYGLRLVSDIVENNSKLSLSKEIEDNYYVSTLKINVTKNKTK